MTSDRDNPPEFSRPVQVCQLPPKVSRQTITASPEECRAVAARLGLAGLPSLAARLELEPLAGGRVRVNGRLTAEVVQTCGVTLVPLPSTVEEEFELVFGPPETDLDEDGDIEVSWDSEDPPDPIVDGCIDLGEVVVEHLALALDPFPRAPGASFEAPEAEEEREERRNPFAALAALRQKKD